MILLPLNTLVTHAYCIVNWSACSFWGKQATDSRPLLHSFPPTLFYAWTTEQKMWILQCSYCSSWFFFFFLQILLNEMSFPEKWCNTNAIIHISDFNLRVYIKLEELMHIAGWVLVEAAQLQLRYHILSGV